MHADFNLLVYTCFLQCYCIYSAYTLSWILNTYCINNRFKHCYVTLRLVKIAEIKTTYALVIPEELELFKDNQIHSCKKIKNYMIILRRYNKQKRGKSTHQYKQDWLWDQHRKRELYISSSISFWTEQRIFSSRFQIRFHSKGYLY